MLSRFKRKLVFGFGILMMAHAAIGHAAPADFEGLFNESSQAQTIGTYPALLQDFAGVSEQNRNVRKWIQASLEELKQRTPAEREADFNAILRYYSQKHQGFKLSALRLDEKLAHQGFGLTDLVAGKYDSRRLAYALVDAVAAYERDVMIPIMTEIEAEIARDFAGRNLLCLGRDFTAAYHFMRRRGKIPADHLFNLNISRNVRDQIVNGARAPMRQILDNLGLTKARLIRDGLVFFDSSMKGEIPKSILTALTDDMTDTEAYQFLSKVDLRYVRSKQTHAGDMAAQVAALQAGGALSRSAIAQILSAATPLRISNFRFSLPADVRNWDPGHLHNIFEHRPKFLTTASGFRANGAGRTLLVNPLPSNRSDRIVSMLGLYADMTLAESVPLGAGVTLGVAPVIPIRPASATASGATTVAPQAAKPSKPAWITADIQRIFDELDQIAKGGYAALKTWQNTAYADATRGFARFQLMQTGNTATPWELRFDGRVLYRLKSHAGEGRNVNAYLTDRGTILKLVKDPANARKTLMQAWAEPIVSGYQVRVAKVLALEPTGIWMEQEAVPGESLEYLYAGQPNGMPKAIQAQVLQMWKGSFKLAQDRGIWMDFKAANCHLAADGTVVFVDYAPRLNKGYWRYFNSAENGPALTADKFLEEFLYRQVRDGKNFKAPAKCGALLTGT